MTEQSTESTTSSTTPRSMSTRGEAAIAYAGKGWEVFPLHHIQENGVCSCGMKCPTPGKHPRVQWKEEATYNADTIRLWWERWPDANIGIATGERSNLYVLDVDVSKSIETGDGQLVPTGQRTLAELTYQNEALPDTLVARTGSGGEHWYFQYPGSGSHSNRVGFAPGLDIRADHGYVVGPGSNHLSGHDYEWIVRRAPAVPPEWLVERAGERVPESPSGAEEYESVGEGGRNDFLTRYAGRLRGLDPNLDEDSLADLLWAKNARVCDPPLDAKEVRQIAHSAMRFAGNAPEPEILLDEGTEESVPPIPEGADLAWSLSDFMSMKIEPPKPLVHGLFDAGTGIMIAGPPNIGKSWLIMQLALAVATGTKFLGHFDVEQSPVLIIDEEGHPFGDQERLQMLINGHDVGSLVGVPLHLSIGRGVKLDSAQGVAIVRRMISRYNIKLVVIDSLIRVSDGEENNARGMANFFAITQQLKQTTGAAFVFVHHIRKVGNEPPADIGELVRGAGEIRAWLDTLLIVLPGDLSTDMEVHTNKQRWKRKPDAPFGVRLLTREDEPWASLGHQGEIQRADRSAIGVQNRIMAVVHDIIQKDLEPTPELIAANIGLTKATTLNHLGVLSAIGLISATPSKYTPKTFVYLPAAERDMKPNGQWRGGLIGDD